MTGGRSILRATAALVAVALLAACSVSRRAEPTAGRLVRWSAQASEPTGAPYLVEVADPITGAVLEARRVAVVLSDGRPASATWAPGSAEFLGAGRESTAIVSPPAVRK